MDQVFISYDPGGSGCGVLWKRRSDGGIEVLDVDWDRPEPKQERIVPLLLPAPSSP